MYKSIICCCLSASVAIVVSGITLAGTPTATLTLNADETYHTAIQLPYELDLNACEVSVSLFTDQSPLECLDGDASCPVPIWFKLDQHYYEIDGIASFNNGRVIASGLNLGKCLRAANNEEIPNTDYALFAFDEQVALATEDGQVFAYASNDEARVLAARTFHGDAVCDLAVTPILNTPSLPWEDTIFSATFSAGTL